MMIQSPFDLAALEASGRRIETPCGKGNLVWRMWGSETETEAEPAPGLEYIRLPLILLHGGGGSWRHWHRTIPALMQQRKVIAVDMPGYGDSAMPDAPVSLASLGRVIAEGLEQVLQQGEAYHLAGFSLGSFIAPHVIAAKMFSSEVVTGSPEENAPPNNANRSAKSLILIHGHFVGKMEFSPQNTLKRWRGITDSAERNAILRYNLGQLMLAHPESADAPTVDLYRQDLEQARLRVPGFIDDLDTGILSDIAAEICTISGQLDPTASPSVEAQVAALKQLRPDAQTHVIANCGHWAMHEAADRCNTILQQWLEDVESR